MAIPVRALWDITLGFDVLSDERLLVVDLVVVDLTVFVDLVMVDGFWRVEDSPGGGGRKFDSLARDLAAIDFVVTDLVLGFSILSSFCSSSSSDESIFTCDVLVVTLAAAAVCERVVFVDCAFKERGILDGC